MTQPIIKPTVGRLVHVYIDGYYALNYQPELAIDTPLAAVITRVLGDRQVNLTVFNHDGKTYPLQDVCLVNGGKVPNGQNYADWMPFQKGQAARTDAAEAAVRAMEGSTSIDPAMVKLLLEKGAVVKVGGIPVELDAPTVILVHAANVPLIYDGAKTSCNSEDPS